MTDLFMHIAVWGAALLGVYLVVYTLVKWRRAARACHPMPFRRRKSYLTGLAFSVMFVASPALVHADGHMIEAGISHFFAA
ncbi:hypothetical protein [uncultured Hyphomonas sp.]|jgi:cytochrome c oxidase assembly factor CtaG|uniref:hypothetical protein n=1 Tax=uncultured Hyphomonas sp. TaxID=225298 RepID=UPI000C65892A|nr:hypothetical protein [Hyphomonadaceae bacterium]MBA29800.1 hypothetical protein [Hyphomonadaceae bacterium]|tara:strand:- start:705 stop:947 length:243 start_codon:yes stop_codon:yes gene_type:complete